MFSNLFGVNIVPPGGNRMYSTSSQGLIPNLQQKKEVGIMSLGTVGMTSSNKRFSNPNFVNDKHPKLLNHPGDQLSSANHGSLVDNCSKFIPQKSLQNHCHAGLNEGLVNSQTLNSTTECGSSYHSETYVFDTNLSDIANTVLQNYHHSEKQSENQSKFVSTLNIHSLRRSKSPQNDYLKIDCQILDNSHENLEHLKPRHPEPSNVIRTSTKLILENAQKVFVPILTRESGEKSKGVNECPKTDIDYSSSIEDLDQIINTFDQKFKTLEECLEKFLQVLDKSNQCCEKYTTSEKLYSQPYSDKHRERKGLIKNNPFEENLIIQESNSSTSVKEIPLSTGGSTEEKYQQTKNQHVESSCEDSNFKFQLNSEVLQGRKLVENPEFHTDCISDKDTIKGLKTQDILEFLEQDSSENLNYTKSCFTGEDKTKKLEDNLGVAEEFIEAINFKDNIEKTGLNSNNFESEFDRNTKSVLAITEKINNKLEEILGKDLTQAIHFKAIVNEEKADFTSNIFVSEEENQIADLREINNIKENSSLAASKCIISKEDYLPKAIITHSASGESSDLQNSLTSSFTRRLGINNDDFSLTLDVKPRFEYTEKQKKTGSFENTNSSRNPSEDHIRTQEKNDKENQTTLVGQQFNSSLKHIGDCIGHTDSSLKEDSKDIEEKSNFNQPLVNPDDTTFGVMCFDKVKNIDTMGNSNGKKNQNVTWVINNEEVPQRNKRNTMHKHSWRDKHFKFTKKTTKHSMNSSPSKKKSNKKKYIDDYIYADFDFDDDEYYDQMPSSGFCPRKKEVDRNVCFSDGHRNYDIVDCSTNCARRNGRNLEFFIGPFEQKPKVGDMKLKLKNGCFVENKTDKNASVAIQSTPCVKSVHCVTEHSPICSPEDLVKSLVSNPLHIKVTGGKIPQGEDVIINCVSKQNERQRHFSEASEDSFVVFDDNACYNQDDTESEYSDTSGDYTSTCTDESYNNRCGTDFSDYEETNAVVCPNSVCSRRAKPPDRSSDAAPCGSRKKVSFQPDEKLCTVHPMIKWSFAYQAARKGPWEEYARDRERFKVRVIRTEDDLKEVLTPEHRLKVYQARFATK